MQSSLCVVLLWFVGVAFGQYMPVCDPASYTGPPSIPLPNFPTQFSAVIEANLGQQNSTWNVREYFDEVGNRGRFEISTFGRTIVGIFDYDDGEIFVITDGDTCEVSLIADPATRSFFAQTPIFGFEDGINGSVHIGTVRDFFLQLNSNATYLGVEVVRGIPCNRWQTCTVLEYTSSYTLDYYFAIDNWDFALGDGPTPVQVVLNALNARSGVIESLNHIYSFVSYNTGPRSVPDEVFTVPFGLLCTGRIPGQPVPSFPEYFSLTVEAVQRSRQAVVVYKGFYNSPKSLSRVNVYYGGSTGDSPGPISLIRDSARSIDYIINRQLNNCTVIPRNDEAAYFQSLEGNSDLLAQLVTPTDLLKITQPFKYTYEGVTNIRGVDVDAWISMQPVGALRFTIGEVVVRNGTIELFFTRPGWRITSSRTVSIEPVLWRVMIRGDLLFTSATTNSATCISSPAIYMYNILDFSSKEPDFDVFDVSTCFSPSEYHVLNLAVPGQQQGLVFSQLQRNLRSAIVDFSKLQPLQVGNIQITGENGTHIFVSLHISNPTPLATTENSKTADEVLQMLQRDTVNGRLPFQISTGLVKTMVTPLLLNVTPLLPNVTPLLPNATPLLPNATPLLLNVNPQLRNYSRSGLNDGQVAGLGMGMLIFGLMLGILGTLLVLLVVRICCFKSTTPKFTRLHYKAQEDDVAIGNK